MFGSTFGDELLAAGLDGLPFSWTPSGAIVGRNELTSEQNAALDAVIAAHDPQRLQIDDYRRAIQAHVDAAAQARQYDSGITCASYLGSTNSGWAAEATIFVAWRDAVWTYAYTELANVQAGQRGAPTVEAFLAELPPLIWPQ